MNFLILQPLPTSDSFISIKCDYILITVVICHQTCAISSHESKRHSHCLDKGQLADVLETEFRLEAVS